MKRALPFLPIMLAGCGNRSQSALSPGGDQAASIAQLSWLIFAGGALILLLVMVAIALAVGGSPKIKRSLSHERSIIAFGIAVPSVVLSALLIYGLWQTRSLAFPTAQAALRIDVSGEQWWWRVNYRANGGDVASANEVRLPVNTPVDFVLTSVDVIHSFWIPSLGGKVDMIPGRETTLRITARRPGIYRGQCAEYCGGPHALMAFPVVAMEPAEFDAWLQGQRRDANPNAEHPGGQLFVASGCGACHAVRGVSAGMVGPDLTTFGARSSVGIDTLAATRENVARFIREGQQIKPRNPMPEFRMLSQADAENIAEYLIGLR